jgi:hypothetical protein
MEDEGDDLGRRQTEQQARRRAVSSVYYPYSVGAAAAVASAKGRNGFWWGMGAFFLFSPLLSLIALTALPAKAPETDAHHEDPEDDPILRRRRLP